VPVQLNNFLQKNEGVGMEEELTSAVKQAEDRVKKIFAGIDKP